MLVSGVHPISSLGAIFYFLGFGSSAWGNGSCDDRLTGGSIIGSGCIAALEAEKFLAEREAEENALDKEEEGQAKKPEVNGDAAPEYRANPLL